MRIPFFHDWDYRGYFGILDRTSGDALFVSDADVERVHGSIGMALGEYGQPVRLDHTNPYHRTKLLALA